MFPLTTLGTWNILLNEYFEHSAATWPWQSWQIARITNQDWGIEDTYYHVGFNNFQALWVMAYPFPSQNDPEYDPYLANMNNRYVYWGPFSLANAQDAQVTFYLLNRTAELADSVWWGAAVTGPTNYLNYYQGGRHSGNMNDFQLQTYRLSELDSMGQTISFCGRPQVYIGWFFKSNSNSLVSMGPILDDIVLGWDDGMFDLQAQFMFMTDLDSVELEHDPVANDTILFKFRWHCAGNEETAPFNLNLAYNDDILYSERRTATGETTYNTFSEPWIVEPGDWIFTWTLDADSEVVETFETNNSKTDTIHVDIPNTQPTIEILTPSAAGDTANQSYLISWFADDPDDEALIYLYYDTDTLGYEGPVIPGGVGLIEHTSLDSLLWDTHSLPNNSTYWILARIDDPYSSMMVYSHGPLHIDHGSGVGSEEVPTIPTEFSLSPLYPNPFNASATLTFGVPHIAHITLQVYNVLGQRVSVLMDGTQDAGYHRLQWQPTDLPSGVYLVRMQSPNFNRTQKVVLMK